MIVTLAEGTERTTMGESGVRDGPMQTVISTRKKMENRFLKRKRGVAPFLGLTLGFWFLDDNVRH